MNAQPEHILQFLYPSAPWDNQEIECVRSLLKHSKHVVFPTVIPQDFSEMQQKYSDFR